MDFLLSRLIIPGLTLLLPGRTDWFSSNFSVAGSQFPKNLLLIVWAIVIARFYHTFMKRTIGQIHSFLNAGKELALTRISAGLLIGAVFLPYRPEISPVLSFLHLGMAFSATVLFFLAITILNTRLWFLAPDLFSYPALLLVAAIVCSFFLLFLCDFLITSALEIFLTLFSCEWLRLFDRRIQILLWSKSKFCSTLK